MIEGGEDRTLVSVDRVSKLYEVPPGSPPALDDLSLSLESAEFVALMGPSGAGKSTLIHLLGGLERPSSGRIMFEDRDIAAISDSEISELRLKRIGLALQFPTLVSSLSVAENVALRAKLARVPPSESKGQVDALLAQVRMRERRDHYPYELSGGEQQRAVIAQALFFEPRLLLADEPTGNLDSATSAEILELLLFLRAERQVAILLATHDSGVACSADRVVYLIDGRKIGELKLSGIPETDKDERRRRIHEWIDSL
jgi:ABC-type lipoprotein export system ATPase subunit